MSFLSADGKLNRTEYIISLVTTLIISFVVAKYVIPTPILDYNSRYNDEFYDASRNSQKWNGVIALITWVLIWIQSIKRLQDAGKSGWLTCVYMLPVLFIPAIEISTSGDTHEFIYIAIGVVGIAGFLYTIFIPGVNDLESPIDDSKHSEPIPQKTTMQSPSSYQEANNAEYPHPPVKQWVISKYVLSLPQRLIISAAMLLLCFVLTAKIASDKTSYAYVAYHPMRLITGNNMFDIGKTWGYWTIFLLTQTVLQLKLWTADGIPYLKFVKKTTNEI